MEHDIIYSGNRVEYRQIVCSQRYAILTSFCISSIILLISIIAAFARAPCTCSSDLQAKTTKFSTQRDHVRTTVQSLPALECESDFYLQRISDFGDSKSSATSSVKCQTLTNRLTLFPLVVSSSNRILLGTLNLTLVCQDATNVVYLQTGQLNIRSVSAASIFGGVNTTTSRSVYEPVTTTLSECSIQRRVAIRLERPIRRAEQLLLNVEFVQTGWNDISETYGENSLLPDSSSQPNSVILFGFNHWKDSSGALLFPTIDRGAVSTYTMTIIRSSQSQSLAISQPRFVESVTYANLVATFNLRLNSTNTLKTAADSNWLPDMELIGALRRAGATWYADRYESVLCTAQSVGFALFDDFTDWTSSEVGSTIESERGRVSSTVNRQTFAARLWSRKAAALDDSLVNETRRLLKNFTNRVLYSSVPFTSVQLIALPTSNRVPFLYRAGFGFIAMSAERFAASSRKFNMKTESPCSAGDAVLLRNVISQSIVELFLSNAVAMQAPPNEESLLRGLLTFVRLSFLDDMAYEHETKLLDPFLAEKFAEPVPIAARFNSHLRATSYAPRQNLTYTSLVDEHAKYVSLFATIAEIVGQDVFERALGRFIERFQSARATVFDFLGLLNLAINKFANDDSLLATNWSYLVSNWSSTAGYPLVTITRINDTHYHISQSLFSIDAESENDADRSLLDAPMSSSNQLRPYAGLTTSRSSSTNVWFLPIRYRTDQGNGQWLVNQQEQIVKLRDSNAQSVVLNAGGRGYYRVHYGADWPNLIDNLLRNRESFTPLERSGIIDDALSLMFAGLLQPQVALRVLEIASAERDNTVWSTIVRYMDWIGILLEDQSFDMLELWRTHVLTLIDLAVVNQTKLQLSRLDSRGKLAYLSIIGTGLRYGHRDAIRSLLDMVAIRNDLEPDLRWLIEKANVQYGPNRLVVWNTYLAFVQGKIVDCERRAILQVLASSRDAICIRRLLTASLQLGFDNVDLPEFFAQMAAQSSVHRDAVWQFITTNWVTLSSGLGSTERTRLLETASLLTKETEFLTQRANDAIPAASAGRISQFISVNIAVRRRIVPSVHQLLNRYVDKSTSSIAWHSSDVNWRSL